MSSLSNRFLSGSPGPTEDASIHLAADTDGNSDVMMGRLEAIWVERSHRGPMDAVFRATLREGQGIVGSADQGGRRQVTLIECRAWDAAVEEVGVAVEPSERRANLLISGLSLAGSRGRTLRVGPCELKIHGETRPCERMDEAQWGLRAALSVPWRGGAFAEVLTDAEIEVGAPVEWGGVPSPPVTAALERREVPGVNLPSHLHRRGAYDGDRTTEPAIRTPCSVALRRRCWPVRGNAPRVRTFHLPEFRRRNTRSQYGGGR